MSEFGKGLTYCLGLFIAHQGQFERDRISREILKADGKELPTILNNYSLWFYGATDHLYDIQIDVAPESIREELKEFVDKCFTYRGMTYNSVNPEEVTEETVIWALGKAKELLMKIDKAWNIPVEKGDLE